MPFLKKRNTDNSNFFLHSLVHISVSCVKEPFSSPLNMALLSFDIEESEILKNVLDPFFTKFAMCNKKY